MQKAWKIILLSAAAALLLCGCDRLERLKSVELPPFPEVAVTEEPVSDTAPLPVAEPRPEPAETAAEEPLLLRFETFTEERYDPAEGRQLILTFSWVTPKLTMPGREEAAAAINEAVAILDETYYTGEDFGEGYASGFNGMLEAAEDNYAYIMGTGQTGMPMEFSSIRSASAARMDDRALSLYFDTYEYTGGAHGMAVRRAYNYDTETGARLSLDSLSEDPAALRAAMVEQMIRLVREDEELALRIPESFVSPADYETAFAALLREGSWYFSAEGITVFSDLYELGPYAAGMAEFSIPYGSLAGALSSHWLPGERHSSGSLSVKPLSEVPDGSVKLLDRLELDGSEELCLLCTGRIYDLRLSRVGYGEPFYEIGQLWACSCMEDGALALRTAVPETIPDLMLSYTGEDGKSVRLLLTQSGRDGSYLLIDEQSFK